jgi:hypothetical protein
MSGPAANRSAIVAAGILCAAGLINSVAAAPLIPGINGYRRDDASPLAWSRWSLRPVGDALGRVKSN